MHYPTKSRSVFRLPHCLELQGLRALAVASVLLYHIDSTLLPSGFVGVDVFFVLSGFLIGRKLLAEMDETGSINPLVFTAARAKRLLPNALLVLLVTAIASYLLLPAYRLEMIGADISAAALLYSNFHFASSAVDYLRIGSPPSPVMHFWSLSIEEQFYLGLPILLWALSRIGGRHRVGVAVGALAVVAVASFALGIVALANSQPDAFFATQNRVWQLAAGLLVGWLIARHATEIPRWLNAAVLFGAATLLLWSLFWLDASRGYPGVAALAPTAGTGLLLIALFLGPQTTINRGLSSRTGQWLGDRSYSIYLWHWPFITIATVNWPGSTWAPWLAAVTSIVAASFAYRFLEEPIRNGVKLAPSMTLRFAATAVAATAGLASLLVQAPFPADAATRAAAIATARKDLGGAYETKCHLGLEQVDYPPCTFGNIVGTKSVLLFGDSHAAQWFGPLRMAAEERHWRFTARTKTSCPSTDVTIWYPKKAAIYEACSEWRNKVMDEIRRTPPDVIVLANFSGYHGWIAENGEPATVKKSIDLWQEGFRRLLSAIPDSTDVWLIRDNPRMATNFQECLSYTDACSRTRSEALDRLVEEAGLVRGLDRSVTIIDVTDDVCDTFVCPAILGGQIAYRDEHHFTASFASTFKERFLNLLEQEDS